MSRCLGLNHHHRARTIFTFLMVMCLVVFGCGIVRVTPQSSGTREAEQPEGPWEFMYTGRQVWVRCEYQNGALHGPWKRYYPDGPPQETGEYLEGNPEGKWTWYYPGGKVYLRGRYLDGKKDGTWKTYTISWLHGHMMRDFCRIAPETAEKSIYLFRDKDSYDYYTRQWIGRSVRGVRGLMTKDKIMVDTMSGSGTLAHELVHDYIQNDFPQIPGWFEEGISALYEQSAEIEGRMVGLVNFRLQSKERP